MARILIVEDEQIIAADLRNQFRHLGHEVVGMAIAGEDAINMADRLKPELVLMDVQLEGQMSGTEAAGVIQQHTGASIIFITAFPSALVRDPSAFEQPTICVGKPFSRVQLRPRYIPPFPYADRGRGECRL